ncbi:MlaD family protein [Allosphingosinicella sp.]|jgi:phospholipid/cholesterol/gamma-HCH transport system substrate-binding protein|uniref:MlaD family protein n=1 Tax=Allosphingosinicella sp. TaxID=2823234 RepID=UPI002F03B8B9
METRSNHILVGTVVLALLAALILFIIWLSQISGNKQQAYDIFFKQSVDGLAKGTAVTYNGVPVGQIDRIDLEERNPEFVRVRIGVSNTTPVLVGTTATIRGIGFTGLSQIQLNPPEIAAGARRPAPITCPQNNPASQCPYGVPVIQVRAGALANLLNTAPELLERVSTLTERLTELLSERNQESIAGILANTDAISRSLAERSPEIAATLAEARIAVRQAGIAAERAGQLANSAERLVNEDGRPLVTDLRHTMRAAERSMASLDALLGEARPGVQAFTQQTLPEIGQLIRDLREASDSLKQVTDRIERQGIGGIIGGQQLPNYRGKGR